MQIVILERKRRKLKYCLVEKDT
ncbi:ferredoxin, partial [Listeria monocytogenes]|nr:ferredoxin [Listeria monocytogenes]EAH3797461.1 ferredoxin [Listeria monocytogenes]